VRETLTRARAYEESEDVGSNPTGSPTIGDVIAARFGRRDILKGALGAAAIAATATPLALAAASKAQAQTATRYRFDELQAGVDDKHHVAAGYDADILIRWGDPVVAGAPVFDPRKQSAAAQRQQFGYNCDFIGYFPMPGAANPSHHGLLAVNLEYTNEELMFPGLKRQDVKGVMFANMTKDLVDIEMAAHGGAVIEVRRDNGKWRLVDNSKYGRRIDATTPMDITGPAAGDPRMRTTADPTGRRALGMINNCAGGVTPWGTWLTCEENVHGYFNGRLPERHREARNHSRLGVPTVAGGYAWGTFHDRFNLAKEPNEPNRFGWVVEIDPFDPASTPKKRTSLGRYKHEGAAGIINKDGRYVVYMGDDERLDYVYRFITNARVDRASPAANRDILDDGVLSVARYNADGTIDWLPLVHGQGPLTAQNGFASQADVLIDTRTAADFLGATPMDRPEDVEANPVTQKVYVILTNNRDRARPNAANPRTANRFGHIIEMIPPGGDHAAAQFKWEILIKAGNPADASHGAAYSSATTNDGWFGMPDNIAFDSQGRMWVATDGQSKRATGRNDGLWGVETEGEGRGTSKHFFRVPLGAELCGPCFTPDDETLFVAVQHPGEEESSGEPSSFEEPSTRWPDFDPHMPPRPSVVAITRRGGGKIGT
jgi:secreted PhoX family phosphatase